LGKKKIFKWKGRKGYNMQSFLNELSFVLKATKFGVRSVIIAAGEHKVFITSVTT